MFDFCAESGNSDKNCTGGNPNDGIAKGGSFDFTLYFLGNFTEAPLPSAFKPLAARFQNTGSNGQGSDVAICMDGSCNDSDLPGVPEPSTYLLLRGSLIALSYIRRRYTQS